MASDEVLEEQHEIGRLPNRPLWVDKFELLEKHIKETNEEIISTRKCIDYLVSQINACNETISTMFLANTRRLALLSDFNNKLAVLTDKRDNDSRDMVELIPRHVFFQFEREYLNIKLDGKFIKMGDELHFLKQEYFSLDRLKVIRNGLHLGTIKKDRFEPNHAFAMFLNKEQVKNSIDFDHNDNKVISYLKGMTIEETRNKKGYVLVCVNGLSLGWGKDDGRIIKNLYPKGLRML